MTAVKGSKQYKMVVVPYRPLYKAGIFLLCLVTITAFSWLTYQYGLREGLETKIEVVNERDEIKEQLAQSAQLVRQLRQDVAELKLGGQVDFRANEEVRLTVEQLQDQIAELNEEIRFYKGVMLPNVGDKGLRIERLDMKASNDPNKYNFSLLLTQVVEKHEYVQGGVEINLLGQQGSGEKKLSLDELSADNQESIRFRFRYFQNIDGELTVPDGFEPQQIMIVARLSGRNAQLLERKFDWQIDGD